MKSIEFLGDSLDALQKFPRSARRDAGFQLDRRTPASDIEIARRRYRQLVWRYR